MGMADALPGAAKACVDMAPKSCVAVQCSAMGNSDGGDDGNDGGEMTP